MTNDPKFQDTINSKSNKFLMFTAILGFWGVASGAFGAHALKSSLTAYELGIWQTGITYLFFHISAMLLLSFLIQSNQKSTYIAKRSFFCFALGSVVFTGSLQLLALSGIKWLGAITPIGGLLLLIGWLLLFYYGYKHQNN